MEINLENYKNKILNGNSLEVLKTLPDNSIDCCITSPPYWGLRDYGHDEQLGSEKHFKEFVNNLCNVFDEVKRVLKPTGTCFVNLGDTYMNDSSYSEKGIQGFGKDKIGMIKKEKQGVPKKSLCMIPERFAIEMVDRGWCLRNQIIWHKPNAMPSSANDRFTVDFEKIFFFVKQPTGYYFEQQIEETKAQVIEPRMMKEVRQIASEKSKYKGFQARTMTRNARTTWSINTECTKEAHFATYPQKLVEQMILAGCPELVCSKCGVSKKTISKPILQDNKVGEEVFYDKSKPYSIQERNGYIEARDLPTLKDLRTYLKKWKGNNTVESIENTMKSQAPHHWFSGESYPSAEDWIKLKEILHFDDEYDNAITNIKFKPSEKCKTTYYNEIESCNCGVEFNNGIVLDPFFGSGTTGIYARKSNRNFVGIELNNKYIKIAENRLLNELGMFL
jgi:site-specific DNA-methyltransferase (adenine-specific)